MRARVRKWGNSLALRIPKPYAVEAGMAEGGEVRLSITDGKLVAEPLRPPRYTLKSLLAGVRKEMVHGEEDFGGPVGREAW
ncbi:MAG: AbrB/MazE/SpoVT family DNA-binding domain-containing protein [Gemmatimonadales bacterium]|nr:AbrB/MazE/SpoVT family DNA-binding domain-containing protein [Gemmatimonadales bacterium]